jgi:hypothetical protein
MSNNDSLDVTKFVKRYKHKFVVDQKPHGEVVSFAATDVALVNIIGIDGTPRFENFMEGNKLQYRRNRMQSTFFLGFAVNPENQLLMRFYQFLQANPNRAGYVRNLNGHPALLTPAQQPSFKEYMLCFECRLLEPLSEPVVASAMTSSSSSAIKKIRMQSNFQSAQLLDFLPTDDAEASSSSLMSSLKKRLSSPTFWSSSDQASDLAQTFDTNFEHARHVAATESIVPLIKPDKLLEAPKVRVRFDEIKGPGLPTTPCLPSADTPSKSQDKAAQAMAHYDSTERDRSTRHLSRIFHMRNLNNCVKSAVIREAARLALVRREETALPTESPDAISVLDLACGKGGDMGKWRKLPCRKFCVSSI